MEDCGNKEIDDSNKNETDAKINDMNEGEITCSDITSIAMMVECEDTKHRDNNDNETEIDMVTLDKET